jgi:predicted dehydrogenase
MIKVGLIGYGYWGPNLVRNFSDIPGAQIISVSDLKSDRLMLVENRYPSITRTSDHKELISNPAIDAVLIATPVSTHFDLAMQALRAGKHVLVEKPMTQTTEEGIQLVEEAQKRNLTLMVDHTYVYTGAVRKIRELVQNNDLGEIYYYDSTRVNLGMFQYDVNVIYDLAVHDLSIMDCVLGGIQPSAVLATGKSHVSNRPENLAYLTLFFDSYLIAHINVNWLSPVKLRQTLIGGSKKMVVFDDLEANEKVKVYDSGITINNEPEKIYETIVGYRMGDIWSPKIDHTEALRVEALHFVDCVKNGKQPITGGEMGLRLVRVLETASLSLAQNGQLIELK